MYRTGRNTLTIDEALDYIRNTNNQSDRYAHIVDMDTYEAYSTYSKDGDNTIFCYQKFLGYGDDTKKIFTENMANMFSGNVDFSILGKYRTDDTQANVVSVGTRVTLKAEDGSDKDYLLLRIIPIESIRKIWVFPVEYMSAEIGIITRSGDYVVPSKAMKCRTFADLIRAYNFEDNYNKVDELVAQLINTDTGIMQYKDSRGVKCYWYYSSFGDQTGIDILGYIPVSAFDAHNTNWIIMVVICGVIFLLILIDGGFILMMNKELRRTAQLAEDASKAKSRFLSTMSHDIRTPMNGIIGMTNIARDNIEQPGYAKECLDKVLLTSDHLLTLVNDILDVSKVESGNMVLTPAVFSMDKALDKLIDIVQIQIEKKQIQFSVHKDIQNPYLIADELRLNQIYINILSNAIKYTPEGGSIDLTLTEKIQPDGRAELTYIVADTGIGMSEDFQKNMYHMFTREVDSKIAKTQGTGLGLAIVKQMVDLMGGTVSCDSEPGRGTTFTVVLVMDQSDKTEYDRVNALNSSPGSSDFAGMRVLAAEDNDLNWEIIHQMLSGLHVVCDRTCNGEECVRAVEASPDGGYDLILMDVQMPVMNGREAAAKIRQSDREYVKNIPIVAMTADSFADSLKPVYERLSKLIENGYMSSSVNETYPDDNYDGAILTFFEGDVPFWIANTESVSGMKKRESKSETFAASPFEYEFVNVPLGDDGVYDYEEPWYGFSVNKNGDNVDYAVEFMRFLSQESELNKLAEIKGMPSVTTNNNDIRFNNALNPEKCAGRYVYDGQLSSVNSIICDTANKMGYGDITTVDEAIDMINGR